ncbi:heme ABC exporter, ATP-binding protein CcmA [Rubellimicrobium thermophilum DSM 16684]|uniref:Heme ABC exporter, ATP-binding protein CcmA n=1 Tax=Rubellimicrobium thermophilum DSM 16684 TaxID=1123069 RepID=S9R0Q1_9RHOB|nr:heme ABC exporter ATP-binding protein CcmA [Rubellimicrobium thermophilum]EPX87206.1 heme ABC exporter, ATP-binding protein CcmA [Rubellimicrobium thermophilum DSM 16684]
MTALCVEGLSVARGGVPLLEGLSFALAAGGALVLRGPNGIGKTTLLRVLAGLAPPLAGRIAMPPDSAAYAGHADGIKATLTVEENLRFWAALYEQRWNGEVLEAFGLQGLRGRPAATLSAGQARRLGLARLAVIGRPILLLDEPTVSLDAASVKRFGDWLRERHLDRGGIAVLATHVELGIEAPQLDLAAFRARPAAAGASDAPFL